MINIILGSDENPGKSNINAMCIVMGLGFTRDDPTRASVARMRLSLLQQ